MRRRASRCLQTLSLGALFAVVAATAFAQEACAPGAPQLIIYHAGSLNAALRPVEKRFTEQTGICVVDVAGGSVDAARQITTGKQPCDIFASADAEVIEQMLKPAHYADYDIRFGEGAMVLAYTTASRNAAAITSSSGDFDPTVRVPEVVSDWHAQLMLRGVVIAGSHPFLDPSGYRADMIFQLMQDHYGKPTLYNALLTHYSISKPGDALGKTYDYQFIYEHSALAAYKADATKSYRYARLPDAIGLSSPQSDAAYRKRGTTIPGLSLSSATPTVRIPATRVTWGLTVMKSAPNRDNAVRFLQLLFGSEGVAMQAVSGPAPISPPLVSERDYARLPGALQATVKIQKTAH